MNGSTMNDERIKELLNTAMGRVGQVELERDLWPDVRRKLDEQTMRVSPFDWALIAAVVAWMVVFPESLIAILYHL
jgi:hypothetical protein